MWMDQQNEQRNRTGDRVKYEDVECELAAPLGMARHAPPCGEVGCCLPWGRPSSRRCGPGFSIISHVWECSVIVFQLRNSMGQLEFCHAPRQTVGAQSPPQALVLQQLNQWPGEGLGCALKNEKPGFTVDDRLAVAAHVGCDDGQADRHVLQNCVGEALA